MDSNVKMTKFFLLVMLVGLAKSQKPCDWLDVTTLRDNRNDSWFKYEVHSRTNAVGLATNVRDIIGRDSLEESKLSCYFHDVENCPGWTLSGFEPVRLRLESLLDWTKVDFGSAARFIRSCDRSEINFKLRGQVKGYENFAEFFATYDVPDNFEVDCWVIGVLYPDGPFDTTTYHGERIRVYDRYFFRDGYLQFRFRGFGNGRVFIGTTTNYFLNGLEYRFYSPTTLQYQEKRVIRDNTYDKTRPTSIDNGNTYGEITLEETDGFRVFMRKDHNQVCVWINEGPRSTDCLYTSFSDDSSVTLFTYQDYQQPDVDVFSARGALQLTGTNGSASYTSLTNTKPPGELCISLRYVLDKDENVKIELAAEGLSQEVIYSANLQGTGAAAMKRFSIIIDPESHQGPLQITFATQQASSFTLLSARQCSAEDRDIIITMEGNNICSTPFCQGVHNATGTFIELGFATKCYAFETSPPGDEKKCYNGGRKVNGWCQCPPGFTGPSCEKACPPGRFGDDCGGTCVSSPDCKYVSLAAPGQPFECARGFTGPKCNEPCESGFYGPDCRLQCGQCDHGTCDRFSGLCDGPCKRGYKNQTCHDHLATVDSVKIISTTFDCAECSIEVTTLSENELKSYPYVKILYTKMPMPPEIVFDMMTTIPWSSKVVMLTSANLTFQLDNLDYDATYYVQAVLIHESGDFYIPPSWNDVPHVLFSTNCHVCTFDRVDVISEETTLSVAWKVSDNEEYPCQKRGFELEVYVPESKEPFTKYLNPYETNTTIEGVFPREGSLRLGAVYETKKTQWTYLKFSNKAKSEVTRTFDIVNKSTRSIDFSWSSSDDLTEDILNCEQEQILCMDRKLDNRTQRVQKGPFTLKGLLPFTTYGCTLENAGIKAIAMTQPDQPTGSPKPHDEPVKVTNSTASVQWKNADCVDINGILKGFRIDLWRGNTNEASTTASDNTFKTTFGDLLPETHYEARVYLVNHLGWNAAHFLSIPFKTRSTSPNAVSELLVYKRTRNDLWLRWSPPDNESNETRVVAYKVTGSGPGVETQTVETPPIHCSLWPNYFCYRLRSLVPDTEYTIEVQARNNKVDLFGPSTTTEAMTKEGVPDAPVDVRIFNRTADSVILTWKIPLLLNSNPKFFVVTLEQTDENDSHETPIDSSDQKIPIVEGQKIYEAKFDRLNAASTYVVTISAGLRGHRTMLTVNTPPKDPPAPPAPTVDETSGRKRIVFHGIKSKPHFPKLLSGYLLLVASNDTIGQNHGITNADVAESLQSQVADSFIVANEFAPSLTDEVFNFKTEAPVAGNFSLIQNTHLKPGREYHFALAAISNYCGASAVSVSPVLNFQI